jgi:hypothetical protein
MRQAVHLSAMGFEEQGIALMRAWHEERRRRRTQRQAQEGPDVLAPERKRMNTGGDCHGDDGAGSQTRAAPSVTVRRIAKSEPMTGH